MPKIDLNQLRIEIKSMSKRSKLYLLIKEELTKLGRWKAFAGGKPAKRWRMAEVRAYIRHTPQPISFEE